MRPTAKEHEGKIIKKGTCRLVAIPDDFFLEGEGIVIRQEKDGSIVIYPKEEAAREAMCARFNPFTEWEEGT